MEKAALSLYDIRSSTWELSDCSISSFYFESQFFFSLIKRGDKVFPSSSTVNIFNRNNTKI